MTKNPVQTGLSQETLKLIACVSMLIDHIGASLVPGMWLREIGRIAFPIYCFLLAEGAHYTKDWKKYGLRLAIGALLSEIPFDLLLFGKLTWAHQSVMVTLLLGYAALAAMELFSRPAARGLAILACYLLAEALHTDYHGAGVLMIVLFGLTRGRDNALPLQLVGMLAVTLLMNSITVPIFGMDLPVELLAVLALIPISLYSGKKLTYSKTVQWAFYLFYPVHLSALLTIRVLLR